MRYTDSIIQADITRCFICGQNGANDRLEIHHVFNGAYRKKSEEYGLKVALCGNKCHRNGEKAPHRNAVVDKKLKALAQKKAMKYYGWTTSDFIGLFGKNYI